MSFRFVLCYFIFLAWNETTVCCPGMLNVWY